MLELMPPSFGRLLLLGLLGLPGAASLHCFAAPGAEQALTHFLKYEDPKNLTATIYSIDRKKAVFKFSRRSVRKGEQLEVFRTYSYPNGTPAFAEKVIYQGDNLQEYDVDDLQLGARGSARITSSPGDSAKKIISYEYTKDIHSTSKPKTRTELFQTACLVGDMVPPFLMDHWAELLRGEAVRCRYIVLDRRETVGFTFAKDSETHRDGKEVIIVKMSPTSRIISALVDPLFFTLEKGGQHRILEYSGRTALNVKEGNKWKDFDGITVFDW
jgi:hypothetical protein